MRPKFELYSCCFLFTFYHARTLFTKNNIPFSGFLLHDCYISFIIKTGNTTSVVQHYFLLLPNMNNVTQSTSTHI